MTSDKSLDAAIHKEIYEALQKRVKEATEAYRAPKLEQAKLLREAVEASIRREKYDGFPRASNESWQAYYDSL